MNPDDYNQNPWRTLLKDLLTAADQTIRTRTQKNRSGRLRRQRDKILMDEMTLEVASVLERLTALGWTAEATAAYVVALLDNGYESTVVSDLRRAYEADLDRWDAQMAHYREQMIKREFPLLWTALQDHLH